MIVARWFFDVVSPFSYLHLRQFDRLHPCLEIRLVPVLFAGLLRRWGHKGPAELPSKRIHTYRYCTWVASRQGLPFRMPQRHPFNPLPTQRLLVALGARRSEVETTFDFIYAQGRDPELDWTNLCALLGVADADVLCQDPTVKQKLIANTDEAADAGVFGVPTFAVRGELFLGWRHDRLDERLHRRPGDVRSRGDASRCPARVRRSPQGNSVIAQAAQGSG